MRGRPARAVLALATAGLVLAACGESRPTTTTAAASAAAGAGERAAGDRGPEAAPALPATVTDRSGAQVTVDDVSRIVVLNGDIAEIVFALGLGANVVATDTSATFPPEVTQRPKIGYQRQLSAEGILSHAPTVVIGDEGAGPAAAIEQLRGAGTPVVIVGEPKSLEAPAAKIRAVSAALGVAKAGDRLASRVGREIADAAADLPPEGRRPRVAFLYVRGTQTLMIGGRGSAADAMIAGAGGIDAGSEAGIERFAPLTPEALVAAAPDVLLLLSAGVESVGGIDGVLGLPGVAQTPAGAGRRIIHFDDLYLIGLGPRTGSALAELRAALHPDGAGS